METNTESPISGENNAEQDARSPMDVLHRPGQGRILGGVAAGLADRLGVPRWAIRLAFVLLVVGGGTGVLLYLAGWLLIPGEGEAESIGHRWAARLSGTQPWVGLILIVVAGTILLSTVPFLDGGLLVPTALLVVGILLYRGDLPGFNRTIQSDHSQSDQGQFNARTAAVRAPRPVVVKPRTPPSPLGQITIGATVASVGLLAAVDRLSPAIAAGPRHYFALALTVLGLGIAIGTLFGKARWLIPFGLLLIPALVATSVAELADGSWQRLVQPISFTDLAPSYEAGAGELVLDLTGLPWDGQTVNVHAELGVGELTVIVPDGVSIKATGEVGIGEFRTKFASRGGLGVSDSITIEGSGLGTVVAELSLGIGSIRIEGAGDAFFDPNVFELGPESRGIPGDLIVESDIYMSQGNIVLRQGDRS